MSRFLCKSLLVSSVFIPVAAMGQDAAPSEGGASEAPRAEAVSSGLTVKPYGKVLSSLTLMDSTNQKGLNTGLEYLRLGLSGEDGIAMAKGIVEYEGNGAMSFREAWGGMKFGSGVTFRFGKLRLEGADAWVSDFSESLDPTFGTVDAFEVGYSMKMDANSVNFGLAQANALTVAGAQNRAGGSNATILSVGGDFGPIAVKLGYGMQSNALIANATEAAGATPASPAIAATANHVEFSAGYNGKGLGAGLWYQGTTIDKPKAATDENGKIKAIAGSDALKSKRAVSSVNLGAQGDSSLFGMTDVLQQNGLLCYGLVYSTTSYTETGADVSEEAKATAKGMALNEIVLSVGWMNKSFKSELAMVSKTTKDKTFSNAKGDKGVKNSSQLLLSNSFVF